MAPAKIHAIVFAMKTFVIVSIAVLALLLGGTSAIFAQEGKAIEGNIRVLKVTGTVTRTVSGKPAEPLKEGMFIQHDEAIKTGADSQAWLLF